uniref:DUF7887 domain-containing protein n=1 Tax=Nicotiana tabacum TaxID=4097 RepID=A0A1S4A1I7_TOBAC|nr:uncharacterized protein LOC104085841 [Nicotiana tomentosiformis]XP_016470547.1 PREDICTED: uncharacterized protein LOC107792822 [Nicotiana tabacum]
MLFTQNFANCYSSANFSYLFLKYRDRRSKHVTISYAKKREISENSTGQENSIFSLKIPRKFLAQAAVGVFALGFIDAGYSGDWSRIGVISKESEELLKIAAYFVVPLCLYFIFSISNKKIED